MKIIGIVGTAKNTGKTTTLAALIEEAARAPEGGRLAVTGIGYDGEEIDTVTGLPKPRLMLQTGTVVCTSEQCLAQTTAGFEIVKTLDARTALGRLVILRITSKGLMVLAGPNTKTLLEKVIAEFEALGIERLFVDGSLNRIAAMSAVQMMIFTTGASRSREIPLLSKESHAICRMFALPSAQASLCARPEHAAWADHSGTIIGELPFGSLFDAEDARAALNQMNGEASALLIPKMASLRALEYLVHRIHAPNKKISIVLNDPTILLLAGEPLLTEQMLDDAARQGAIDFCYRHPIRAAAMTVNPFYPEQHEHAFTPAYIDKDELLRAVQSSVDLPVFNIRENASPKILFALL